MNFDSAFLLVIGHEGGYVNNSRDPGGETKYGISKRAYPRLDIKNLSLGQAKAIYLSDYWNKLSLEQLPEGIKFDMFDTAVNSGVKTSAMLLQRALNITDDGVIGNQTIKSANAINPQLLDKRLSGQRLLYLCDLKTFPDFGKGWVRRVANNMLED